jgi:rod shape-determining protein MreC
VLLITDSQSGVSVRLEDTNARGVVNGRSGSDLLRLDVFDRDARVKKGDLVFTSGLDISVYPAGIPVGRVEEIHRRPGGIDQTILVRPVVDVGRASFVKAVEWPPTKGQGG